MSKTKRSKESRPKKSRSENALKRPGGFMAYRPIDITLTHQRENPKTGQWTAEAVKYQVLQTGKVYRLDRSGHRRIKDLDIVKRAHAAARKAIEAEAEKVQKIRDDRVRREDELRRVQALLAGAQPRLVE